MQSCVEVQNASKKIGNKPVLKKISIKVDKGKICGFIGPSGAGKTTLIKLIVGMTAPDSGKVFVLNKQMPALDLLKKIGYMAQSDALYPELTGKENLVFFASLYKMTGQDIKKRLAYVAELVNLADELNKKVAVYSGGMKRRLSLAVALIHNPEILILDEPTVGIDPELKLAIWNELLRLKKEERKTILITTHVMDEAEKCDFIFMLKDGCILSSGTPRALKTLYQATSFDQVFLKAGKNV